MKSMIIKDLYNIGHNIKTMLLILIVLAVFFIPSAGPIGYIAICAVMCSMMVVTTFSFDDMVRWNRCAMTMPLTRRELVDAKYVLLLLFTLAGSVFGAVLSFAYELAVGKPAVADTLLGIAVSALIGVIFGCIIIPLLFRYGAEKARMMMLLCFALPTGIVYGMAMLAKSMKLSPPAVLSPVVLICCTPLAAVVLFYISERISVRIFRKKELI